MNIAFEEGQYAFSQGENLIDNPYCFASVDHTEWEAGWKDAEQETYGEF